MGAQSLSKLARPMLLRARSLFRGRLLERLRHVVWAGLLTLGLYSVMLLQPLEDFLRLFESRVADRSPSGEVVFVT